MPSNKLPDSSDSQDGRLTRLETLLASTLSNIDRLTSAVSEVHQRVDQLQVSNKTTLTQMMPVVGVVITIGVFLYGTLTARDDIISNVLQAEVNAVARLHAQHTEATRTLNTMRTKNAQALKSARDREVESLRARLLKLEARVNKCQASRP